MSEFTTVQSIAPYLNPNYWGGHCLGYGEQEPDSMDGFILRNNRFAKIAIALGVQTNEVTPIQTFYNGQVFDPEQYHPGTIVLFREETLSGAPVADDYPISALSQQAVPMQATDTSPCFGEQSPTIGVADDKRYYESGVWWGVVPLVDSKEYIAAIPAYKVVRTSSGARATGEFSITSGPVIIGDTVHQTAMRGREERLKRVNILHLIAYGSPQKQSRKARGLIPRLAFSGSV